MAIQEFSRHTFARTFSIGQRTALTDRVKFRFRQLSDNRTVPIIGGQTLFTLANAYLRPLPRPAGLWWVIADFQPEPIHDPTLEIERGRLIVIPSVETVLTRIFNEERRNETF